MLLARTQKFWLIKQFPTFLFAMKATGGKYVPPHKRRTAMINPKPTNTNRERKREKKQSFGIVPCQTIEGKRCILLQISYSCTKYDFKVDPLRGNTKKRRK
mmetsp:Transcript_5323/g.6477  ORF Transcript_5323/g.6477 Transcript_5323/m.6477 type:complete len:101 (+) Transcript_5323:707-1009(+)